MKNVTIFTSNNCPHCSTAKEYLKSNNISYEEKNISEDPSARQELIKKKAMGVPTILIEDEMIVGFDKRRIDDILGL